MRQVILHKGSASIIKKLTGLASLITIIICGFQIASAIQYSAITVASTSGNITVNSNTINNLSISPAIIFNQANDSITYRVTLSNPDQKSFRITHISDDNTNQYITTSYDYSHEMDNNEKPILIGLTYTSYVPLGEELNLQNIHISINIEEENAESESNPEPTPEPENNKQEENQDDSDNNENHNQKEYSNNTTILPDTSGGTQTPNTGSRSNANKYLTTATNTDNTQILSNILIIIIATAVIITIAPTTRRRRVKFVVISAILLIPLLAESSFTNTYATSTNLQLTIIGKDVSAMPDTSNPQNVVSAVFPNIYKNRPDGSAPGNNIVLKTLDSKYVMMDTGPQIEEVREAIYNSLRRVQDSENIVIDYLILSHLDGDHVSNVYNLINDSRYTFKNIIIKHESKKDASFRSIATHATRHNVHVIVASNSETQAAMSSIGNTNYGTINEGSIIEVGKYLKLNFFNVADVYENKECQEGAAITWTANTNSNALFRTPSGQYVYFDGSEYSTKESGEFATTSSKYPYANITLKTTATPIPKDGGSGMNRYFYASKVASRNICQSNPNSFGILAEVTTTGLKKYAYFSGDLENAGYSTLSSGNNSSQIFNDLTFENGDFKTVSNTYVIPAEDNTANAIYNKLATDASSLDTSVNTLLNNIVIYQDSHHGINNSDRAIQKLNLNRSSGIYSIEETFYDMSNTPNFNMTKSYYYTLGNIPANHKIRVGIETKEGVECNINSLGATTCAYY